MAKYLQKYLCQKYGIFSLKFHIAKASYEIEFVNLKLVIKKKHHAVTKLGLYLPQTRHIHIYTCVRHFVCFLKDLYIVRY